MRRRLKNFLPVFLVALVVQIFAPIAACWAAGIAASDPLAAAVICHDNTASGSPEGDQTGQHVRDGCCSVCSVLQTGAPIDAPLATSIAIERPAERVAWLDFTSRLADVRAGSQHQARAPPYAS